LGSLRDYDVFLKVNRDIIERSPLGASITLFALFLGLYLVNYEFNEYSRKNTYDVFSVDVERNIHIPIFFDISFFEINCQDAYIDVVDELDNRVANMHHNIRKIKISKKGEVMDNQFVNTQLGRDGKIYVTCRYCSIDKEIPLYDIEDNDQICCTCDDVKFYNKIKGLSMNDAEKSVQCQYEKKI